MQEAECYMHVTVSIKLNLHLINYFVYVTEPARINHVNTKIAIF